jgi:hypothetical protein
VQACDQNRTQFVHTREPLRYLIAEDAPRIDVQEMKPRPRAKRKKKKGKNKSKVSPTQIPAQAPPLRSGLHQRLTKLITSSTIITPASLSLRWLFIFTGTAFGFRWNQRSLLPEYARK